MKKYIVFLSLFFITNSVFGQGGWELKKSSEGINIYLKKNENSNICEFKGTATVNAKIEQVLEILKNGDKYPEWVDQISFSKKIEETKDNFVIYYQIKLPIGFKNRDVVIDNQIIILSENKIKINLVSKPTKYPEQKEFVRITDAYGYWLLVEENNKTNVIYQFYSNPNGAFPSWIINLFIVDGPYKTLKNLKEKFN